MIMTHRLAAVMTSVATTAALLSACASTPKTSAALDPKQPERWKIEPILAVHHSPALAPNFHALGRYHDGMRQHERAIEAYQRAIAADPTHVEAHNALGAALANRARYDEAEAAFRRALNLDSNLAHVQSNLGHALMLAGKHDAAVAALKVAVRLAPDNATNRANLREALKQWDVARGREPAVEAAVARASAPGDLASPGTKDDSSALAPSSSVMVTGEQQINILTGLPTTIEIAHPATKSLMNRPATTTRSQPPMQTASRETPVAPTVPVTPTAARSVGLHQPVVTTRASPALHVVSQPTVAALPQTLATAPMIVVVPSGMSLGGAASVALPLPQPATASRNLALTLATTPSAATTATGGSEVPLSTAVPPVLAVEPPTNMRAAEPVAAPAQSPARAPDESTPKISVWRHSFLLEMTHPWAASSLRHVAATLVQRGLTTEVTTLRQGQDVASTVVYYQAGHRADAERVAHLLGVKVSQVRWAAQRLMDHDVRVVLGRDATSLPTLPSLSVASIR
jgi:hypothetical protein